MRYTRRYNAAPAIVSGIAGTAVLGTIAGASLDAGRFYPIVAAALFGLLMAAMLSVAGDHHPFDRFGAANAVTTLRAMLMALVAALVTTDGTRVLWFAIGTATIVALLDGLDGWLARRTRMASDFGARFDMETDAALILVLSALVWQHDKAGDWVLLCGLMRYGFVAAGWLVPWLRRPLRPTLRGKTVAVCQIAGLNLALAPVIPVPQSTAIAGVTLAALAWSFAMDIMWLARRPG